MRRLARALLLWFTMAAGLGLPPTAFAQSTVPAQPNDPFGQEVMLPPRTLIFLSGAGTWDTAYDTLVDAFAALQDYLTKAGIRPAGPGMTIYTAMDDTGFNFQAAVPVAAPPTRPPAGNIEVGESPTGKALKFVHRGSFEATVSTYDAISHYVEERQIDAKDLLIEEYLTDVATTPDDKLVINIFVPIN
jgi:effector-binding domain-containing protein